MIYEELYTKCKNAYNLNELNISDFRPASTIFGTEDAQNSIIIWFKDGAKTQYTLDEEHNIWTVNCLKLAIDSPYLEILNMTNKEAAAILSNLIFNVNQGRGNGKTLGIATRHMAFAKAIKLLEETPDTATDIVEKECQNPMIQQHRGLRASMHIADEPEDKRDFKRFMNPPMPNGYTVVHVDLSNDKDFSYPSDELIDDTSMHPSMNESHSDYCKRMVKILGINAGITEEETIEKVDALMNSFSRTNDMSPEDIKLALEKQKD